MHIFLIQKGYFSLSLSIKDIFLCNWHIFWQNTLYLYLGKFKKVHDNHYKWLNWIHEDYSRTAQEKCNLQVSISPQEKLDLSRDSLRLDTCLNLSSLQDQTIVSNVFILKGYLFMGLYNPYWNRKAQDLYKPIWNRRAHYAPI